MTISLPRRTRWVSRTVLPVAVLGALALPVAAEAAPGDPFDPSLATVFIAQVSGASTQLKVATTSGGGTGSFTNEGSAVPLGYNSIAYNTADNYIYGIVTNASTSGPSIPVGALVRIGQGGVVTRVGTSTFGTQSNTGVMGPDGYLYVANANSEGSLQVINTATGALVTSLALSEVPAVSDLSVVGGYFWGVQNSTKTLVRIDPATGTVTRFPDAIPTAVVAGSVWTYGNGNLGVKNNDPGIVYQLSIGDPGSASPTFTLVDTSSFPATPGSDGTAIPGVPPTVDLLAPTNGAAYEVGEEVTVAFECGPTAVSCVGTLPDGDPLDTSTPGEYQFEVKATDSAGTVTTVVATYTVAPVVGTSMIDPAVGIGVGVGALVLAGGVVLLRRRNAEV